MAKTDNGKGKRGRPAKAASETSVKTNGAAQSGATLGLESRSRSGLRRAGHETLLVAISATLLSCGPPTYFTPDLPPNRLVSVTVDDRAEVQLIDGHRLVRHDAPGPVREFRISTGCHQLTARYGQSYLWIEGDRSIRTFELVEAATRVRQTTYRTEEPIRFHLLAKPRRKYWVTATFTGDVFLPRISEIDESSGDAVATILPDTPCSPTQGRER